MFFLFLEKLSWLLSYVKTTPNFYIFMSSESQLFFFNPKWFLGCFFHYFGHHGRSLFFFAPLPLSSQYLDLISRCASLEQLMGAVSHSFLEKSKKYYDDDDDDDDDYFNIMFYYFFPSKSVMNFVPCQNYSKLSYFYVFKGPICFFTLKWFLECFSLFWSPRPLRIAKLQIKPK